jgi:hypothetical protein
VTAGLGDGSPQFSSRPDRLHFGKPTFPSLLVPCLVLGSVSGFNLTDSDANPKVKKKANMPQGKKNKKNADSDANPKVKKKDNMPQGKKIKKNAKSRYSPGTVTKLIQLLPPAARQKIVDLHFENLLNLKLGNTNRHFTHFLMDRAKVHENTD